MSNIQKRFSICIAISRTKIFEIAYHGNFSSEPYFATEAAEFNHLKTDYKRCGQAQDEILEGDVRKFWEKWDKKHLKKLTNKEYTLLLIDIIELLQLYPYNLVKFEKDKEEFKDISFYEAQDLIESYPKNKR